MKKQAYTAACLSALLLTGCELNISPDIFGTWNDGYDETFSFSAEEPEETEPELFTEDSTEESAMDTAESVPEGEDAVFEAAYARLYEALSSGSDTADLPGITEKDLTAKLRDRLLNEHPELFWLNGSFMSVQYPDSATVTFSYCSDIDPDMRMSMQEELERKATEIAAQIPENATDYEKVLFVHDWIIDHTRYDFSGLGAEEKGIYSTAYGCLINGKAVCAGYSCAFVLIMNLLGIESGYCTGTAKGGSHAWNYVRLDGDYYWLDVTWDDPASEESDEDSLTHDYFLITDDMLARTRTFDDDQYFIPVCKSDTYNYFRVNNTYLPEYSLDGVLDVLQAHAGTEVTEIMFGNEAALNSAKNELFGTSKIFSRPEIHWDTPVTFSYNDDMYTLTIPSPAV